MDRCITDESFTFEPPKTTIFSPITSASSATLEFHLLIHNPSAESSLTPSWDVPTALLSIPRTTKRDDLLATLRAQLPISANRPKRQPKLEAVTLYLTYRGEIVPLEADEKDWHFRNAFTKTELLSRTEMEWYWLKEMMAGSESGLKCYLAIRGERQTKRNAWWPFK